MRLATATTAFLLAAVIGAAAASSHEAKKANYVAMFEEFKTKYQKTYFSPDEEAKRLQIFIANMHEAEKMQALNPHAQFGVNGYSDVSKEEFKVKHSGEASLRAAIRKRAGKVGEKFVGATPKTVDWRSKGVVTPIKNQLTCGGCWAFSTTGNIEGQWAIAGHGLVSLSEQELISCTTTCNGCHGGIMDDAFEWLLDTQNGGITSEAQYPFVSGEDIVPACDLGSRTPVAFISNKIDVAHEESSMATFVATKGPLSIAVDSTSFQTYKGGILTNCVGNQVDHAVLIVGYDFSGTTPYWIVKNQWGTTWGEDGYIMLAYGSNQCLLTTFPSSAVVSNPPSVPPSGSPAPPSPPATSGGTFTQFACTSSSCLSGCQNTTLPNGKCLSMSNGGSAITSCGQQYLHMMVFNSSDCTGAWQQGMVPLNSCNPTQSGTYLYDECSTGSGSGSGSSSSLMDAPRLSEKEARESYRSIFRVAKN